MTPTRQTVSLRLPAPADVAFRALGTDVRLIAAGPRARSLVERARAAVHDYDRRLSRFRAGSELCALNADPRPLVPASPLLRDAVEAALWAADRSRGLVDPCLLDALETAGYVRSFGEARSEFVPPGDPAAPARPDPDRRWRAIRIERDAIARPPGVRLDLGGSGKGHLADRLASLFAGAEPWVVDCGGDLRAGGGREVLIEHPLRAAPAARLWVGNGAVATSSVVARAWRSPGGRQSHHLIDPATRRPAWTGLLAVTALAPSALEAETLAKTALLSGPAGARGVLSHRGGVIVHPDGAVEEIAA